MHLKPKKGLGQHFLVDQNIQRKIISNSELKSSDIVLEIGSGRGELTQLLAKKVERVYAIEIDSRLYTVLKDKFKNFTNLKIIQQDILKFNLRKRFKAVTGLKVIGNIPYYITTPIIEHLLKFRGQIDSVFITVQKEFAKRMAAKPGSKDYGSFSCFVQYYTEPKIIFLIKKTCFLPSPKVDSCFLRLDIKRKLPLKPREERLFFEIIRKAFNQRRKTLRNSLLGIIAPEKLGLFFKKYKISPDIRPEDLSLSDFANLAQLAGSVC